MEIRIENTIPVYEIEKLTSLLNGFFNTDFSIVIDGSYIYFRDGGIKSHYPGG